MYMRKILFYLFLLTVTNIQANPVDDILERIDKGASRKFQTILSCFPGLVGNEQPRGMGRSAATQLVQTTGSIAEEDIGKNERAWHETCLAGLLRYDAS